MADEHLTRTLRQAAALADMWALVHPIAAGSTVASMAERGLL
ncbi:hypothetical protein [Variovorax sp. V213]